MSWSLINSLGPSARGEHERLRASAERAYYSPPARPPAQPHARLALPTKPPDKNALPKGEPNFGPFGYPAHPPYRTPTGYEKMKDGQHLPAPPPLVPEPKNSVIVKHDTKQIHLEQKHPYPSKPRSEPSPHYPPYRTGLSPHAPPHPHAAPAPAADKGRRLYQPPPARSPAYYSSPPAPPAPPPARPKVSSPAPPHMYGKPGAPSPAHYAVAVEPPMMGKAEQPPVPYPPPSAYSPALRTRPPPLAHSQTPPPRAPPPRAHGDASPAPPCQTQPLDLGVPREDPDRLSPRKRNPYEPADSEAKRRRMESEPASSEPLIASAATVGRTPLGSEPAPQAPGPPCDVRVPSADGSVETPEKAAGASPAPSCVTPSASPAPAPTPPSLSAASEGDTPVKTASPNPKDNAAAPVRHLGKKAWLQRHETAPIGEGDCSGGGGVCVTLPMTITRVAEPEDTTSGIVVPVATKSIQRSTPTATAARAKAKARKTKENGRIDDPEEDTSSSDRESTSSAKRKPPKAKRKKGAVPRKAGDEKKKKASESGSESDKESDDKDSDSGASGSGSGSTSSKRGAGNRSRGRRSRGGGGGGNGRGGRRREEPPRRSPPRPRPKPTNESFLQNGPCFEVAPRLSKCRECRWSPAQRDKDMPNIFCRFYAFRRLKYAKNRQLAIAGFSDPYKDAEEVRFLFALFLVSPVASNMAMKI